MPAVGQSGSGQVRQVLACVSCKTRKRKCDKALPQCSSCTRSRSECAYLASGQARNADIFESNKAHASYGYNAIARPTNTVDISTISFLDPTLLQHGQIEPSQAPSLTPPHILKLLGDIEEVRAVASRFFSHIHLWMPFISKSRFYDQHLAIPLSQAPPHSTLLLLALKLITVLPNGSPWSPRTQLYHASKHFYLDVENSGVLSVTVLQAGVLIALYEIGHAMYPAAFLSIGTCARYANVLGIGVGVASTAQRVLTFIEMEEKRRVWWALVILDRFVGIGCPGRPCASPDPTLDDFLPADDDAWDQGTVNSDNLVRLSSPMSSHMSKFALLCQAARLLSQVSQEVCRNATPEDDSWVQLDRTLQSMLTAALDVAKPDYDQITFIYSSLVALYVPYLYVDDTGSTRSRRAKAIIQQITETITGNLIEQQCILGRDPEDMSPWGLFFAYHICRFHTCSTRNNAASSVVVKSLKDTFVAIAVRWTAAGAYLRLLEACEVMKIS